MPELEGRGAGGRGAFAAPVHVLRAVFAFRDVPRWPKRRRNPSPGFGCKIRTERPVSDPDLNLRGKIRIRIRTPSAETDIGPNPNLECRNRSEPRPGGEAEAQPGPESEPGAPNPDQGPIKRDPEMQPQVYILSHDQQYVSQWCPGTKAFAGNWY